MCECLLRFFFSLFFSFKVYFSSFGVCVVLFLSVPLFYLPDANKSNYFKRRKFKYIIFFFYIFFKIVAVFLFCYQCYCCCCCCCCSFIFTLYLPFALLAAYSLFYFIFILRKTNLTLLQFKRVQTSKK